MSSFHHGHRYKTNLHKSVNKPASGSKIKEFLGYVAGISGIIVFYFWIAGRVYAAGYFRAMNIPSYMVSFPVWEYLEQSWLRLTVLLLTYLLAGGILSVFISVVWNWVLLLVRFVGEKVKPKHIFPKFRFHIPLPDLNKELRLLKLVAIAMVDVSLFGFLLYYVFLNGIHNGNAYVFSAQTIKIVSSEMNFPQPTDLKLLTYNQEKYFVYESIDQTTCKPKVYIFDESNIISVELGQNTRLDMPSCKLNAVDLIIFQLPIQIPDNLRTNLDY